ncbi:hypothetical protein EWM64_g2855 [Hericium alpestre]|uniref:Uncharacterized protein n=1 Tax=Hericium alpestre TaxID=135208 RepID=A0A4Z0A4I5_9AGAM|nr:hypothetical protein EWM64_g2855 [Hericium alpestre]
MSELTGPTASLPNLESLELTDTIVQDGLDFVRRLVFPNTAKAHVRLRHDPDALDCLPSIVLMIALTTSLANDHPEADRFRDPTPLRSLRITHLGGAGISMHLGTEFYSFQDWEGYMPDWRPKYSLSLSLPHHPSELCKIFVLAMCHSLPLEDLEALSIEGEFFFGKREWLYAFGHIEGLRDIRVSGLPIFGFAEMFKKLEGPILDLRNLTDVEKLPTQAEIPIGPVMPALTHLAFEMADFVGSPELLHNLLDGLQLRKDAEMEERTMDSVHIRDCDITEDQFHEFAPRLVGSCQWDMEKSGLRNVWVDEGRYSRRRWHVDDDIDEDEDDGGETDMAIVYG